MQAEKSGRISISTLYEVTSPGGLAKTWDLDLETCDLVLTQGSEEEILASLTRAEGFDRVTAAHGPFLDLNTGTADRELAGFIREKFLRTFRICRRSGIRTLVFHTGWVPGHYPEELWLEGAATFWRRLLEETGKDFRVFLENVYEADPGLLARLLERIDFPGVELCLDTGHMNVCSPGNLEDWLDALEGRIGRIHLHNNSGKTDEHNGLESGTLGFPEVLLRLEERCPGAVWNLEIRNGIESSIKMVREVRK